MKNRNSYFDKISIHLTGSFNISDFVITPLLDYVGSNVIANVKNSALPKTKLVVERSSKDCIYDK